MKNINIDGANISKSITSIIDHIKYRKYAKEGYITVLYINKENNTIKIMDGKQDDKGALTIKGIDNTKFVNKVYIMPTKHLVTKCCIVKEDVHPTIDIEVKDMTKLTPLLLDKYTKTKIMDELKAFDIGQVLLGVSLGAMLGAIGMFVMILLYNSFM